MKTKYLIGITAVIALLATGWFLKPTHAKQQYQENREIPTLNTSTQGNYEEQDCPYNHEHNGEDCPYHDDTNCTRDQRRMNRRNMNRNNSESCHGKGNASL